MRVTPTECSLGGLLRRRKDEGREIFLSRGEEKTMCVQEIESEREGRLTGNPTVTLNKARSHWFVSLMAHRQVAQ